MNQHKDWLLAPLRPVVLAPPAVGLEQLADGSVLLRSPIPLAGVQRSLTSYLEHWAEVAADRPFLRQRVGPWNADDPVRPWRTLTYGEALQGGRSIAQAMLDRGLGPGRPVLVLSGNSIEHALLMLGAFLAGVPLAPIAPAYSLLGDFAKLRLVCSLIRPGLVMAQSAQEFARAFSAIATTEIPTPEFVTVQTDSAPFDVTSFAQLIETQAGTDVDEAGATISPDTVAKILFTSGSTGQPKGVPNTHRMLCANQAMMAQIVPPHASCPPVFLDWMPWSHTFGGNVVFDWILRDGGTLYMDEGKPVGSAFNETLSNLREVSPTHYFNVPSGYAMLVDALEADSGLRKNFFKDLQLCYYGGSGLPQATWDSLQTLSVKTIGHRFAFTTGCGSTETGPISTFMHWTVDQAGIIGLPLPGVEVKLVPVGGRFEMGVKGPNVFTGYHAQPELTQAAFDSDGFYRTGDALRFLDPANPSAGLVYEGRTVEDFKLATGTFVAVGLVRLAVLSAVPLLQEAVLVGPDRPWLGLLAWLDQSRCQALIGDTRATAAELIVDARVRETLAAQLNAYNAVATGSSQRIKAMHLIAEPPSVGAGEITEKGYVNQKAVLLNYALEAASLFTNAPGPDCTIAPPQLIASLPTMRSANSA